MLYEKEREMNYRKNIITYLIISIILIIIAVLFQIFLIERVSVIIVSILIGAATGIIATMIACVLDNNQKLQEGVLLFERATCHILGEIYKIANLDATQATIVDELNNNAKAIIDYGDELKLAAEKIDLLFILRKREQKLKLIYNQLENIVTFILYEFKPIEIIKVHEPTNYENIALFEALKLIKFAREFNPQPILKIIQKSKNNIPTNIGGREEFFNIIFEKDIFNDKMKKSCDESMKQEINSLCNLYSRYDINEVMSTIDKVQMGDWAFSTKISRKKEHKINKLLGNDKDR